MKRKIRHVISCFIVLLIIITGLYLLSFLTERKASYSKYEPFYEQKENFDVLFFGTSHALNGIFPMELWNDYGIVSYNFAGHSNSLALSYWQMINAFDYTTPKLVVIDCLGLSGNTKISSDPQKSGYAHLSLDAIPLSRNKIKAVNDLVEDKNRRLEFLFDFTIYHDRWKELESNDFKPSVTAEKGADSRIGVAIPRKWKSIDKSQKMDDNTLMVEYLTRIIEDCQKRNIDVLLTYLPFPASQKKQLEANRIYDIAEQYNVNYLDFATLKDVVDFDTDLYDSQSHLNPSGARKVTDYIGKYIMEHYDIPDQRNNSAYDRWFEDYSAYTEYKIDLLKQQTSLKPYLMLLNDKNLSYSVYIKESSQLLNDPVLAKLLENTGIDLSLIEEQSDIFVTVDNEDGTVLYTDYSDQADTSLGTISIKDAEEKRTIFVNDKAKLKMDMQKGIDVGIIVFTNADKMVVTSAKFKKHTEDFDVCKN